MGANLIIPNADFSANHIEGLNNVNIWLKPGASIKYYTGANLQSGQLNSFLSNPTNYAVEHTLSNISNDIVCYEFSFDELSQALFGFMAKIGGQTGIQKIVLNINKSKVRNMFSFAAYTDVEEMEVNSDGGDYNYTSTDPSVGKMWSECNKLKSINLKNFATDNMTVFTNMFMLCKSLTTIDISNFNTADAVTMDNMFNNCQTLKQLVLGSGFNMTNVNTYLGMFTACNALKDVYAPSIATTDIADWSNITETNTAGKLAQALSISTNDNITLHCANGNKTWNGSAWS